jgi:hypothetical protein
LNGSAGAGAGAVAGAGAGAGEDGHTTDHTTEAAQGKLVLLEIAQIVQRAQSMGQRIYIGVGKAGDEGLGEMQQDKDRVGDNDNVNWEEEHIFDVGPDYYWARAVEIVAIESAKVVFAESGAWELGNKVLNRRGGGGGPIPAGAAKNLGTVFILIGQ